MSKALLFANGDILSGATVDHALASATHPDTLLIAVDGGIDIADHYQINVHAVVGDFDSISDERQAQLQSEGVELITFPAEKDFTDLELALKIAVERGADWIRIIGGIGGRLDQTIANVYLLALPELAGCDVRFVAGEQTIWLLTAGTHQIEGEQGDTLSLIPIGGSAEGITTADLYYPLHDETLIFGPARGVSNVLNTTRATVSFKSGTLLAIHTKGRA
jgi:thiamine pyrophosphokinase